jgi:hypothetical protein
MSETINTRERIEVISKGEKNQKGKYIYGPKGSKKMCSPKVAEKLELNGWIEPVKVTAKEAKK